MNRAMALGMSAAWGRSRSTVWLWACLCLLGLGTAPLLAEDCEFDAEVKFLGSGKCLGCHIKTGEPGTSDRRSFCLMNEATTSRQTDRHSLGFQFLQESPITRKMEANMGKPAGDLVKSEACLACHAGWTPQWGPAEQYNLWLVDGVSCEACHGPSSVYLNPHAEPEWRLVAACDKTKQGMIDLRDPVRKAEVCLSCHVGDHSQGRFVTHAMYAAGHPPLPSFELATYLEQMPPHWRKLREKGALFRNPSVTSRDLETSREAYLEKNRMVEFESDTRDLRVGALMTLRASLQLASGPVAKPGTTPGLPDYAQFDCQACHHDLADPGFRQSRFLAEFPPKSASRVPFGRLRPFEWAERLARVAVADSDRIEFIQAELKRVRAAFVVDPLGSRGVLEKVVQAPEDGAAAKLQEWARELSTQPVTAEVLDTLSERIFAEATEAEADYHSARQLVWALQIIGAERLLLSKAPPELTTTKDVPPNTNELSRDLQVLEDRDVKAYLSFREKVIEDFRIVREKFNAQPNVAQRMSARRITEISQEERKERFIRDDKDLKEKLVEYYEADQTEILRSSAEYDPRVFADWIRSLKDQPAGDRADRGRAKTSPVRTR